MPRESTNLSRDNLGRKIGRGWDHLPRDNLGREIGRRDNLGKGGGVGPRCLLFFSVASSVAARLKGSGASDNNNNSSKSKSNLNGNTTNQ